VSGYFRGITDSILMRFTDLILVIPVLALAATLGYQVKGGGSSLLIALVLTLVFWTSTARIIRGEFLSLREKEFVEAARASGASDRRIIFKHMLPNVIGPMIVSATLAVASAILVETALSFVGAGVKSPDTSLGLLVSTNQRAFNTRPWLFWYPGLIIVVIALTINFIGDGLRDAFDPKQTRVRA
jgi:ABC-type dipeptide/oligopeptide/nickel transport system permease subunit